MASSWQTSPVRSDVYAAAKGVAVPPAALNSRPSLSWRAGSNTTNPLDAAWFNLFGEFIERDDDNLTRSMRGDRRITDVPGIVSGTRSPRDLPNHRCINICTGSAGVYRWEFDKGPQSMAV